MSDGNMVEAVARAICKARGGDPDECLAGYSWVAGEMGRAEGGSVCHRRNWQERVPEARAALSAIEGREGWQPIATAPRDGRYILAIYRQIDGYAAHLHGRAFVVRHEGETDGGYDLGWAIFPGFGGVPDKCLSAWRPLPAPPSGDEG